MTRMVKRLSQLEIDEVSLVDRPANQHGLVAIAKNDQEDAMPDLFDAEGTPVELEDLQVGDFVYDDEGTEFQWVLTDDDDEGETYDEQGAEEREPEMVGKSRGDFIGPRTRGDVVGRTARAARGAGGSAKRKAGDFLLANQMAAGRQLRPAREHFGRNKGLYVTGGVAAAGGYGGSRVGKSYGQEVLETLSKAVSTSERDVAVAKAFDAVEEIAKRNESLEEAVSYLLDERERSDYVELAKAYELPMEYDELGGLMHRAAQVLDDEDLARLDRILSGASEVNKALFEEQGYSGQVENDVLAQVYAVADQAVAKNAELGLTREQAVTALFSANPEAYDQYELEQNQR